MGRRVLVVDDDAMIRSALALVVGEQHEVTLAASVREALVALAAGSFDVVLCDLQLGDGGAHEVYSAFARGRADATCGFVVMTGGACAESELPFLRSARHVLEKPFDFEEALELLELVAD
jgi:DNA-binding NtrC family response regulator